MHNTKKRKGANNRGRPTDHADHGFAAVADGARWCLPRPNNRGGLLEMDSIMTNPDDRGAITVAVVDRRPDDYADLLRATRGADIRWEFAGNGQQALRLARTQPVDVWMVNDYLPDMSGLDVCALLKNYLVQAVIYVVTDNYDQAIEREARICGAALFGCKPIQPDLISQLTVQNRKHVNGRRTFNLQTRARPPT
ncbi:MAG: response regulator [Thermoguttaceae bacterium]|jgi:response regulator RpfG family c-di-GMP phosphodiesterase